MLERDEQGVTLLTPQEVAALLKVSVRAVYKLARRHRWTFQRTLTRRCVRYERRGLLRWIRSRTARGGRKIGLDTDGRATAS